MTAFILIVFLLPMIGLTKEILTVETLRDVNINSIVFLVYGFAWGVCFIKLMSS